MTAWSAKVFSSSIWLSEKGRAVVQVWSTMMPTAAPSRTIGTARTVRTPAPSTPVRLKSRSACASSMWMGRPCRIARPVAWPSFTGAGYA